MVYAGARGKTERQMAQTLHFTLGQDSLHKACNALNLSLIGGGEDKGISGLFPDTYVANALWGQAGDRFLQQFLDLLAENYGSELQILDFAGDPEGSCHKINDWASQKTQGRIQDLLPEGSLGQLTRLVLTNAIYFYATWGRKFEQSRTRESTFHLTAGGRVTVPLMEQTEQFGYAEGDGYQAVELPYAGRSSSMVIILPPIQGFESFSTGLDAERLAAILRETQPANVHLALPRFRCISEVMLGDRLEKLGMADAFSPAADFSGITGRPELCISQVFHKAFVAVDEAGTEAAAATAVVFDGVTCPQPEPPVEFIVDHPFVFLIRDTMTGSILFLGHVVDPTA